AAMKVDFGQGTTVNVRNESREEDADEAPHFDGIYRVTVTGRRPVAFVPEVRRDLTPWPPSVDPDSIADAQQARLLTLSTSAVSVTPNAALAGPRERLPAFDPELDPPVILYVEPVQFARFLDELAQVEDLTPWVYSSVPWPAIAHLSFAQFMAEHVL